MDIESKITITLSEDDVKEIVAGYLTNKGYRVTPENVNLFARTKWVHYGLGIGKLQVPVFKECTATVKGE